MRALATFLVLLAAWLLWSGLTVYFVAEPHVAHGQIEARGWHVDTFLLVLGLVSCAGTTLLAHRMGVLDSEGHPYELAVNVLMMLPWLAYRIALANWDVAGVILRGNSAVESTIFRTRASQRTAIGTVIHANTITITPGTITLDARNGSLIVHALTAQGAVAEDLRVIDERILRVEGSFREGAS